MHNFNGTFNKAQFDRLKAFAMGQRAEVSARIAHLEAEIDRTGVITFSYDSGGIPTGYTTSPSTSYLARLLAAYEVLGGDVFYDLNIRNRTQPLFLVRADESTPPQMFSDGTVMGGQGLADGPSATLVQYMRGWMPDVVDYKRDYLERKIRRMVDYGEQLRLEVELLHRIIGSEQAEGSLNFTISEVQGLLDDPMYRAVSKEGDAHNKLGGAPYASYQPGPDREGVSYQRGFGGPSEPGDKGDTASTTSP